MRSLRTQLSLAIMLVVFIIVALTSLLSNILIGRQFEEYVAEQQRIRMENIANDIAQYYNASTDVWDVAAVHTLGMYSLNDGYIITAYDSNGAEVWNAENHDVARCAQIMDQVSARMEAYGTDGDFTTLSYGLAQDGQEIGSLSVRYYGPYFLSESDFSFLSYINGILAVVSVLAFLSAFVTGTLLARRISRPIQKAADIAGQIAAGHYDVQFESGTKTRELDNLVVAVNQLAEALAKQEQLRRQLTADVAHELRTPLTILGIHLEGMAERVWEVTPESIESCHEEILRLNKIVADLEQLERIESTNLKLDKTPTDLLALAKTVCANFAGQLQSKNLHLDVDGFASTASIDKDRISGVITNLMSNAVKYTPPSGEINISIRDTPDHALLIIEDTGPGIPEEELPFIFERFYRADKSRNGSTGGAGIGLTIVKSVVTAHGGTVTAANTKDAGSRFTVSLPKDCGR